MWTLVYCGVFISKNHMAPFWGTSTPLTPIIVYRSVTISGGWRCGDFQHQVTLCTKLPSGSSAEIHMAAVTTHLGELASPQAHIVRFKKGDPLDEILCVFPWTEDDLEEPCFQEISNIPWYAFGVGRRQGLFVMYERQAANGTSDPCL